MKNVISLLIILNFSIMAINSANARDVGKIYVFESDGNGFNTKTIFYDDGKEVVAFDAQFTIAAAKQAIDFLRTKTKNPIRYLVVTHPNPDKFNGIPAFKEAGARVVMSKLSALNMPEVHNYKKYYFVEIAKMFTDETYPQLPTPDITFEDNYTLSLANGGKVELVELKQSGISTNETVAHIIKPNAVVVGDLVHHNAHAWLEGPIVKGAATYNNENWINVLYAIQKKYKPEAVVYGGRGESGLASVVIPQQIAYLQTAKKLTTEYLASIGNDKSKVDYAQLQKNFEKAFPQYSLGFMIVHGAYGIVASLE